MSSPPLKKMKDTAEETPMHIISSETQNRETQNNETQNKETQNSETQKNEAQNRETQNNGTQNNGAQNREIPSDIIETKILPRLPAKSLLRFKSVRKDWCRLISSSEFINNHAFRPNPLSSRSVLSIAHDSSLTAIDYGDLDFTPFGQYSSVNPIFLIGSCNGLVLLISADAKLRFPCLLLDFKFDFRVFNPVLGDPGITISPPPNIIWSTHAANDYSFPKDYSFANDYSFGFGYSSTHNEYYIAAINFPHTLLLPGVVVFLYTCSARKWSEFSVPRTAWRYIEEQRMYIAVQDAWYKHSGTLVNEALHWSVTKLGYNVKYIVCFDLVSKKVKFMKLPHAYFGNPAVLIRSAFRLCCLNDCLCAWAYSDDGRLVDLWMMKEYGPRKPWTRLFCGDMKSTYWYFFGFTKRREVMMFNFDGLQYLDFSCITPKWRQVYFPGQVKAVDYVQSLLSPHSIIRYPTSGEENK